MKSYRFFQRLAKYNFALHFLATHAARSRMAADAAASQETCPVVRRPDFSLQAGSLSPGLSRLPAGFAVHPYFFRPPPEPSDLPTALFLSTMPSAHEHHFPVARTARYYQLGEITDQTRQLWVVCHGYGQLSAYFIRHFAHLVEADPSLVVVAPEGLSRFYLQGTGGRVGATWMTREDRLTEIDDYVAYLNQLVASLRAQAPEDVSITALGFSQGAATVSRWLAQADFRPARLILWAGTFPPDMELPVAARLLRHLPITLVCGTQDEFIKDEDVARQQQFLRELSVEPIIIRFEGKHTLDAAVLSSLAQSTKAPTHSA